MLFFCRGSLNHRSPDNQRQPLPRRTTAKVAVGNFAESKKSALTRCFCNRPTTVWVQVVSLGRSSLHGDLQLSCRAYLVQAAHIARPVVEAIGVRPVTTADKYNLAFGAAAVCCLHWLRSRGWFFCVRNSVFSGFIFTLAATRPEGSFAQPTLTTNKQAKANAYEYSVNKCARES